MTGHICTCLWGRFFTVFGIAIGGFHHRWRHPININWMNFKQMMVKAPNLSKIGCFLFKIGILMGGKWGKLGIVKVKISKSGRHIHLQNFLKLPPLLPGLRRTVHSDSIVLLLSFNHCNVEYPVYSLSLIPSFTNLSFSFVHTHTQKRYSLQCSSDTLFLQIQSWVTWSPSFIKCVRYTH